ncbi:YciI family protein [Microbulbifer sp. SAOS-129_SWC]|uniref:YciI family protein n=1 Tax=Microbulbifer sp. SAOS-129_SWC TaxID=3145235 RepID=UPI00321700AE
MNSYLAIYIGTPDSMQKWDHLSDAEREQRMQEGMAAWHAWMDKHKEILVASGGPLGKTKRIDPDGITDIRNNMTGYVIVEAESHDAAAKLFEGHPHFTIFPGNSVEVMECKAIPTA